MPDVKETFERVTRNSRPDPGALERQRRRQDDRDRRQRITAIGVAAVLAAIVTGAFVLSQHSRSPAPAHSPRPNSTQSAVVIPPVQREQVLIAGLDGTTQVIPGIPANAESPTLSPDGSTIAFVSKDHGAVQLGLIGSDGQGLRFITHLRFAPSTPAWAPDGSRLVFAAGVSRLAFAGSTTPSQTAGQVRAQDIFIVNADGSHLRRLTSSGHNVDQWPAWSPDGSTIAYSVSGHTAVLGSGFYDTQEIWAVPVGGGAPTRLTHNGVFDDMPSYSHDGTMIAYSHGGRIWLMDANGGHQRELSGQPAGSGNFNPRWDPIGYQMMILTFERFGAVTRSASGSIVTLPLLTVHIYNLIGGTLTTVPVKVADDINAPSWTIDRVEAPNPPAWLPTDVALLVNSYPD
jgi:Tol biopolymer transport system component